MTPLVSVIIPSYNSGPRILQTLGSVLAQDATDLEIVVVDDGSTDGTPDRIQGIDHRINLIRQQNQGIAGARNTGIRHANGEFIAFLDHDDIWHPQKISAQLQCFYSHPSVGCVFSDYQRWDETKPLRFADENLDANDLDTSSSGWIYHLLALDNLLLGTVLFRRTVIDSVGEFDASLPPSDDWDYVIRASRLFQFCKLRQVTTMYRIHDDQTSRKLPRVNISAEFRHRTIRRFGMTGPDGSIINSTDLAHYFFLSHVAFGSGHYQTGDPRLAFKSFLHAISYRPLKLSTYAYLGLSGWRWLQQLVHGSGK